MGDHKGITINFGGKINEVSAKNGEFNKKFSFSNTYLDPYGGLSLPPLADECQYGGIFECLHK